MNAFSSLEEIMTKQTTLWIVGIATLALIVAIGFVAVATQVPNPSFRDAAAILTFITGAAVAIERIIEVMWTIFGGVWGTYWPLSAIHKQVKGMVEDLDSALKPFHETSRLGLDELVKQGQLTQEELVVTKKE